jgi:hypothetical protein
VADLDPQREQRAPDPLAIAAGVVVDDETRRATVVGTGCIVCGRQPPIRPLFMLDRPIVQCDSCGLVFDRPANQDEASAYTRSYYHGSVYVDYLAERPVIRRNAQISPAEIEALASGRCLLDVGCAAGVFLEAARDRGWGVQGVEVSEYAAKRRPRSGARRSCRIDRVVPAGTPTR